MNKDILQGNWKQLKGKIQQQWGEITNDELDRIQGNREEMIGLLQEKYGYERQKAERELDAFLKE